MCEQWYHNQFRKWGMPVGKKAIMGNHSHRLKALCASHISPPVKQSNQVPMGGNVQCV